MTRHNIPEAPARHELMRSKLSNKPAERRMGPVKSRAASVTRTLRLQRPRGITGGAKPIFAGGWTLRFVKMVALRETRTLQRPSHACHESRSLCTTATTRRRSDRCGGQSASRACVTPASYACFSWVAHDFKCARPGGSGAVQPLRLQGKPRPRTEKTMTVAVLLSDWDLNGDEQTARGRRQPRGRRARAVCSSLLRRARRP